MIRSLEVLGEATKHVPAGFRNKHPEIPWSKMAGMRDVLIHDYMGVDLKTVWKVAQERLPEIRPLIDKLVIHPQIEIILSPSPYSSPSPSSR